MRKTKISRLAAVLLAAALLASGCAPSTGGEFFGQVDPPEGQVLRYISGSEPESLDPQMSSGQPEARVHMAIFEGLVEYHPKTMEPMPAIAEERGIIDEDDGGESRDFGVTHDDLLRYCWTGQRGARWLEKAPAKGGKGSRAVSASKASAWRRA